MLFYEAVCTQCGKEIYPPIPSDWVYKREGNLFFCSWHCLCDYDRKRGERYDKPPKSGKEQISRVQRNADIIKLSRAGKSYSEIALMYNLCPEQISRIVRGKRGAKRK